MTRGDLGFGPCHGQLFSTLFVGVGVGCAVVALVLGGALMAPIDAWRTSALVPLLFLLSGAVSLIILEGMFFFWAVFCVAFVLCVWLSD